MKLTDQTNDDRYICDRNNIDFDNSYLILNRRSTDLTPEISWKLRLLTNQDVRKIKVLKSKINPLDEKLGMKKANVFGVTKDERNVKGFPLDVIQAHTASTNFYHNILDLSCQNVNAIALKNYIFLWHLNSNSYTSFERGKSMPLTSLAWNADGTRLAFSKENYLQILGGSNADTLVRSIRMHHEYCSLSWRNDLITCGAYNNAVDSYDLRCASDRPMFRLNSSVKAGINPTARVKWSTDGKYLATSDPYTGVKIWDVLNLKTPLTRFTKHVSTVKGLAWCPYEKNSLATGGGYFDGQVHVWNCNNGNIYDSVTLNCQITGLLWSEADQELCTAHARRTQSSAPDETFQKNKIHFWKYHSFQMRNSSSRCLKKLNHFLCNTEEVISITSNETYVIALCGFNLPKLYLWEKVFNKVTPASGDIKSNWTTDLNKLIR